MITADDDLNSAISSQIFFNLPLKGRIWY